MSYLFVIIHGRYIDYKNVIIIYIKLPDELKNIQKNMKKLLVFSFCEIFSLVLKMCLVLQEFFFRGRGFQCGVQKPYAPSPALCIRYVSILFCFCVLFWLDLFTTQVRNCFSNKLAVNNNQWVISLSCHKHTQNFLMGLNFWYMFLLLSDQSICPSQAKFQALLAVAVFMFKVEFWVKNAHP